MIRYLFALFFAFAEVQFCCATDSSWRIDLGGVWNSALIVMEKFFLIQK